MPIQEENIVFLKSQVMDDVPEGGGAATGNVVTDGVLNNVFEDISDLDRAYGRFNLRKLFVGVRSLDTDLYGGAKLAVTALPTDPALGYAVFSTDDAFDVRTDAADAVQSYLYKGPMWPGALYDNHIEGMRAIRIIQRVNTALPPIGKTLCLVEDEGLPGEKEQYVRVTKVEVVETTFTDDQGDYQRWVITLTLSDALRFDFDGHTPSRTDAYSYSGKARLRDTTVADATRYYGSQPVHTGAVIGDLQIRANSMFAQLVPSAQTETPLVSHAMSGVATQTLDAGGGHSVEVAQTAHTRARAVTAENRRLNWIEALAPIPAHGSLSVSFMSQGNWYELMDTGSGVIAGSDPSVGAGTIDYTTGSTLITLGALPDAGSQIMFAWASPTHYTILAGNNADLDSRGARVEATLDALPVDPVSLVVSITRGGAAVTATTSAAGVITGTGISGFLLPLTGEVTLFFTQLPDAGTAVDLGWDLLDPDNPQVPTYETVTAPLGTGRTFSFGQAVTPGDAVLQVNYRGSTTSDGYRLTLTDDGNGHLIEPGVYPCGNPSTYIGGQTLGTIDYLTGDCVLTTGPSIGATVWQQGWDNCDEVPYWQCYQVLPEWVETTETLAPVVGASVTGTILTQSASTMSAETLSLDLLDGQLGITLTHARTSPIVPGSVRFTLAGRQYIDNGAGALLDTSNVQIGALDYDTGTASLTSWPTGATGTPTVSACLIRFGDWTAINAVFRTQLAPVKPEALSISVTADDGTAITGTADADGVIAGDYVVGVVNYEFGTAQLAFGEEVTDPLNPTGPLIWQPLPVDPSTLRYNAVAYSYLPLDADILGIDPVRLPSDGRVPIYRDGDIVYVMHSETTAPVTPTANVAVSLGRTRVAWVRVIDADGETVSGDLYTLDRANGTVTFPSLSGITTPITIKHTVGDLRMVTDAQISGWLTLSRALSHDFPADESIVAGCLLFGDRRARVSAVWDQTSWTNVWQDSIIGSAAAGTLNTIDYPITVTNEGCDTDRWVFTCTNASSNAWTLTSEKRGLVWSGTYAPGGSDVAPINARTRTWDIETGQWIGGTPYLTIPGFANGGGWSTGNCVRINTVGAIADFWIARSIQQSEEPLDDGYDSVEIYALGNVDRP